MCGDTDVQRWGASLKHPIPSGNTATHVCGAATFYQWPKPPALSPSGKQRCKIRSFWPTGDSLTSFDLNRVVTGLIWFPEFRLGSMSPAINGAMMQKGKEKKQTAKWDTACQWIYYFFFCMCRAPLWLSAHHKLATRTECPVIMTRLNMTHLLCVLWNLT